MSRCKSSLFFSLDTLTAMLEPYVASAVALLHDEINSQNTQFRSHAPLVDKGTIGRFALQGPAVYIDWRDRNLAHSLLRLVCDAAKAGVTEVAIHLGAGHFPGVYEILNNTIQTDALEKSLLLRVDTSITKLKDDLNEQDKQGAVLKAFERMPAERKFE